MPRLAAKVGVVSFSKVLAAMTLVVASAVLARRLPAASYGTFQQSWLVLTVATTLLLSGMPLAVYYFVPRETPEGRAGFLRFVGVVLLALGAVGALVLFAGSGLIARSFHNAELAARLPIVALFVLAILPAGPLESFLIAENRHATLARITLATSLLFFAAALLPPLLSLDLAWLYAGLVAYAVARSALLFRAVRAGYRGVLPRLSARLPRDFLVYSIPLGANEALRIASGWLDKTLVSAKFDPETFAVYANGAIEIPLVGILLASVTSVLMPEFSRLRHEGEKGPILALWNRAILRTGLLLLPLFAFAAVFAREVIVVLFSERYAASALPFRVYLLLLPLRAAAYTPILLALGRSRTVLVGALGDLVLSLGLALFLMPRIGFVGPAVATVVATYAQALFYLNRTGRAVGVRTIDLFPWRGLAGILAAAAIPALALAPLLAAPLAPAARLALAAPAYALLFVGVARIGVLPREEREFLWGIVRLGRERLAARG